MVFGLQNTVTSVLAGLNVTKHCVDHFVILLKPWFRVPCRVSTFVVVVGK